MPKSIDEKDDEQDTNEIKDKNKHEVSGINLDCILRCKKRKNKRYRKWCIAECLAKSGLKLPKRKINKLATALASDLDIDTILKKLNLTKSSAKKQNLKTNDVLKKYMKWMDGEDGDDGGYDGSANSERNVANYEAIESLVLDDIQSGSVGMDDIMDYLSRNGVDTNELGDNDALRHYVDICFENVYKIAPPVISEELTHEEMLYRPIYNKTKQQIEAGEIDQAQIDQKFRDNVIDPRGLDEEGKIKKYADVVYEEKYKYEPAISMERAKKLLGKDHTRISFNAKRSRVRRPKRIKINKTKLDGIKEEDEENKEEFEEEIKIPSPKQVRRQRKQRIPKQQPKQQPKKQPKSNEKPRKPKSSADDELQAKYIKYVEEMLDVWDLDKVKKYYRINKLDTEGLDGDDLILKFINRNFKIDFGIDPPIQQKAEKPLGADTDYKYDPDETPMYENKDGTPTNERKDYEAEEPKPRRNITPEPYKPDEKPEFDATIKPALSTETKENKLNYKQYSTEQLRLFNTKKLSVADAETYLLTRNYDTTGFTEDDIMDAYIDYTYRVKYGVDPPTGENTLDKNRDPDHKLDEKQEDATIPDFTKEKILYANGLAYYRQEHIDGKLTVDAINQDLTKRGYANMVENPDVYQIDDALKLMAFDDLRNASYETIMDFVPMYDPNDLQIDELPFEYEKTKPHIPERNIEANLEDFNGYEEEDENKSVNSSGTTELEYGAGIEISLDDMVKELQSRRIDTSTMTQFNIQTMYNSIMNPKRYSREGSINSNIDLDPTKLPPPPMVPVSHIPEAKVMRELDASGIPLPPPPPPLHPRHRPIDAKKPEPPKPVEIKQPEPPKPAEPPKTPIPQDIQELMRKIAVLKANGVDITGMNHLDVEKIYQQIQNGTFFQPPPKPPNRTPEFKKPAEVIFTDLMTKLRALSANGIDTSKMNGEQVEQAYESLLKPEGVPFTPPAIPDAPVIPDAPPIPDAPAIPIAPNAPIAPSVPRAPMADLSSQLAGVELKKSAPDANKPKTDVRGSVMDEIRNAKTRQNLRKVEPPKDRGAVLPKAVDPTLKALNERGKAMNKNFEEESDTESAGSWDADYKSAKAKRKTEVKSPETKAPPIPPVQPNQAKPPEIPILPDPYTPIEGAVDLTGGLDPLTAHQALEDASRNNP